MQNSPYFLAHEGVKGRSGKPGAGLWYRHGKLTPEGYRHYYGNRVQRGPAKDKPESATWKSKDARYLSDAELNRRNSRLQREQQYKQMTKSTKRKAAEWIGKTASAVFIASAIGVLKGRANQKYRDLANEYLPKAASFIKQKGAYLVAAAINKSKS